MTNTDVATATTKILAWLAEQPCPCLSGSLRCRVCLKADAEAVKALGVGTLSAHSHGFVEGQEPCLECRDDSNNPTGLAFPWASEKCQVPVSTFLPQHEGPGHHPNCGCRVPKAVGLEELLAIQEMRLFPPSNNLTVDGEPGPWLAVLVGPLTFIKGEGETPLLAALRAVATKAGYRNLEN